jgi:hypothetical protein
VEGQTPTGRGAVSHACPCPWPCAPVPCRAPPRRARPCCSYYSYSYSYRGGGAQADGDVCD